MTTGAKPSLGSITTNTALCYSRASAALVKGKPNRKERIELRRKLTVVYFIRVDLTVANHVHLIEPHWNPMAEAQAVDRVHRIGQDREVVINRYIVPNSIETVSEGAVH